MQFLLQLGNKGTDVVKLLADDDRRDHILYRCLDGTKAAITECFSITGDTGFSGDLNQEDTERCPRLAAPPSGPAPMSEWYGKRNSIDLDNLHSAPSRAILAMRSAKLT